MSVELPKMTVAVDLVILTVRDDELSALVIRRAIPPFEGQRALPGGFVLADEDLEAADGENSVRKPGWWVSPVTSSSSGPTGHLVEIPGAACISVAYLALAPDLPTPLAGSDRGRG